MVDVAYYDAEAFLKSILDAKPILDKHLAESISEYISVGELEIAFEGAFLWYLDHETRFSHSEKIGILLHSRALGIHKERSIDEDAWTKFQLAFR